MCSCRSRRCRSLLEQPGKANAILVATDWENAAAGDDAQTALSGSLRPRLEDYGLRMERLESPTNCLQISADQLVLPDEVVRAAEQRL